MAPRQAPKTAETPSSLPAFAGPLLGAVPLGRPLRFPRWEGAAGSDLIEFPGKPTTEPG